MQSSWEMARPGSSPYDCFSRMEALPDDLFHERWAQALERAAPEDVIYASCFTLDEPTIVWGFRHAAERGSKVRIILDRQQFQYASSNTENARVVEAIVSTVGFRLGSPSGGRSTIHQKTLLCLHMAADERGVFCKVVDAVGFIGSGNATGNSKNRCFEYGIGTKDMALLEPLKKRLEGLWDFGEALTFEAAVAAQEAHESRRPSAAQARRERSQSAARDDRSQSAQRGAGQGGLLEVVNERRTRTGLPPGIAGAHM